jgi:hypothetical protein
MNYQDLTPVLQAFQAHLETDPSAEPLFKATVRLLRMQMLVTEQTPKVLDALEVGDTAMIDADRVASIRQQIFRHCCKHPEKSFSCTRMNSQAGKYLLRRNA